MISITLIPITCLTHLLPTSSLVITNFFSVVRNLFFSLFFFFLSFCFILKFPIWVKDNSVPFFIFIIRPTRWESLKHYWVFPLLIFCSFLLAYMFSGVLCYISYLDILDTNLLLNIVFTVYLLPFCRDAQPYAHILPTGCAGICQTSNLPST